MPAELRARIRELFLNNRRGRPSILKELQERGVNPYKFLAELVLLRKEYSLESIVEYLAKKYKIDTSKMTISNIIRKAEEAGIAAEVEKWAQARQRARVFYETEDGELRSDIDYIQSFIERKKNVLKTRVLKQHLQNIQHVTEIIGKLPDSWTEDDIARVLNKLYEKYKKQIMISAKFNHKGFYGKLSEKELDDRARENVRKYLTSIRVILRWIGRSDVAEKFGHSEWKRQYTITDYLTIEEFSKVINSSELSDIEKLVIKLHITLGCREGHGIRSGLSGLQWSKIDWQNRTIDVYESKTKGGTIWRGCYLDLFFNLTEELKSWYAKRVRESDYILESLTGYDLMQLRTFYASLAHKISRIIGRPYRLHFNRKTHAVWLVQADIALEMIAGKPEQAFFGVGWEDLTTLMKHYAAFTRSKILREYEKVRALLGQLGQSISTGAVPAP